jgi:type II secretory pathway pseudopilin PulG
MHRCATPGHDQTSLRRRCGGFTIIEMMVVVMIIILLLGIGVVGITKFNADAEAQETRSILATLEAAHAEYIARMEVPITQYPRNTKLGSTNNDQMPYTISTNVGNRARSISRFIEDIRRVPEAEALLENLKLSGRYTVGGDQNGHRVFDAWGNPVRYFERNFDDGTADTNRVPYSNLVDASRNPFFLSTGPSGNIANTDDNILSFDLR